MSGTGRRGVLIGALAAMLVTRLPPAVSPAWAIETETAKGFVRETVEELVALLRAPGDAEAKAGALRRLMEERAAMPQIARFAAGRAWRRMTEEQRRRFVDAFADWIARSYADRFQEYADIGSADEVFRIRDAIDLGRKGVLVKTEVIDVGEAPIAVDWLVTDRTGRPLVADIVIEGVSMVVTKRDEIGAMLEAHRGDIEKLISDLAAA